MKMLLRILDVIYLRIMADKKRYLQTYIAVKDNYILITIGGLTNVSVDFLKAKIFLHIGNEVAHFQRCDAGIGPILKIPRSNCNCSGYS